MRTLKLPWGIWTASCWGSWNYLQIFSLLGFLTVVLSQTTPHSSTKSKLQDPDLLPSCLPPQNHLGHPSGTNIKLINSPSLVYQHIYSPKSPHLLLPACNGNTLSSIKSPHQRLLHSQSLLLSPQWFRGNSLLLIKIYLHCKISKYNPISHQFRDGTPKILHKCFLFPSCLQTKQNPSYFNTVLFSTTTFICTIWKIFPWDEQYFRSHINRIIFSA